MTPSTSLTLQGFLQGLHGSMFGLIGSLVAIVVILLFTHWVISKSADSGSEVATARSWANRIFGVIALLVILGFGVNAATYATNIIPRSTLDRSSIYEDMNENVER